MSWWQGVILGLVQGLSEFLPISSSGHLTIFQSLFGFGGEENLKFDVAVHFATVLSTLVIFRKSIINLLKGLFTKVMNKEKDYILKLLVSMIPILLVGFLLKPYVEKIFATDFIKAHTGNGLLVVGIMLVITAVLLLVSEIISAVRDLKRGADAESKEQKIADKMEVTPEMSFGQKSSIFSKQNGINYLQAFLVGIAQSIAVLPGLSRSGSTIATGLISKVKKSAIAQFSFLMVIVPILGEAFLQIIKIVKTPSADALSSFAPSIGTLPLLCGFVAAFVSGLFACNWMIQIIKKFNLYAFAVYCFVVGVLCIVLPYVLK